MYGGYGGGGMMPNVLSTGEQVMMMPTIPGGVEIPPGLEYLYAIASAHVQQKTDMLEIMSRIDTPNKYMIYNDQGQFIYFAQEIQNNYEFRAAQVVGDSRGFRFHVTDAMGRVVFTIFRTSKLWTNCEMIVEAPPGMPCGYASFQSSPMCRGIMTITDQFRRPILTIPFPSERDAHMADRGYPLMLGGQLVGAIIRKWPGFQKQVMTNCDNFALTFPPDLDVRCKCVLLACAILIDFIDFEDKRDATRGKRKTISPQARASLGNPYQASFDMMGGGAGMCYMGASPYMGSSYTLSQQSMQQPSQSQSQAQPYQKLQQQPVSQTQTAQPQQQSLQQPSPPQQPLQFHGTHPEAPTYEQAQHLPRKKGSKSKSSSKGKKAKAWQRPTIGRQQMQPMQHQQQQTGVRVAPKNKEKKGGLFKRASRSAPSRSKTIGEQRVVKSEHVDKKKKSNK
ncbi:hypothetical protein PRIPAC_86222 [Pristionchus pacificus]|uniref:Uncharacterized protein n=1 Tax=Pristionchus pacificus TaxID=54126 RepID=A0A2A6BUN0_PRIPA|nr:hypothetical protein PRIPAC_86222 [Pristionchus pacificus]|eukprot:PDM69682.1 hypothetical protein PRIPAC_44778 [Pristionchus pacificus]